MSQFSARSIGARLYSDYRSMFDEAGLDAVFICVTPDGHGEPELAEIDRGIGLFVEKPLGVDEEASGSGVHRRGQGQPNRIRSATTTPSERTA